MVRTLALVTVSMLAFLPASFVAQTSTAPTAAASAGPVPVQTVGPGVSPPAMQITPQTIQAQIAQMQHFAAEQQALRSEMIGALTPVHRALLAQIVGGLAISAAPDLETAARQLDAALSPSEVREVTRVEQARTAAAFQDMQTIAAQAGAALPPAGSTRRYGTSSFDDEAGSILLRSAAMGLMQSRIHPFVLRAPSLQPDLPASVLHRERYNDR